MLVCIVRRTSKAVAGATALQSASREILRRFSDARPAAVRAGGAAASAAAVARRARRDRCRDGRDRPGRRDRRGRGLARRGGGRRESASDDRAAARWRVKLELSPAWTRNGSWRKGERISTVPSNTSSIVLPALSTSMLYCVPRTASSAPGVCTRRGSLPSDLVEHRVDAAALEREDHAGRAAGELHVGRR